MDKSEDSRDGVTRDCMCHHRMQLRYCCHEIVIHIEGKDSVYPRTIIIDVGCTNTLG